jgi:chromosome segregation ATPase
MWNLEYELIAILLITAIIGLLMGRFLCKSGESDEKIKKEKVVRAYQDLQVVNTLSEKRLKEQTLANQEQEDSIAELEQMVSNLKTQLNSSDKHGAEHLEQLKVLQKYQTRFEALSIEFSVQEKQLEKLKEEKREHIENIEALETSNGILGQSLESLEEVHEVSEENLERVSADNEEHRIKIEELLSIEKELRESLENYKIEKHERLEYLEKEYAQVVEKLNFVIDEKEDLMSRIRAISSVVGAVGVEEH